MAEQTVGSVESSLEKALEHAEDEEAEYWIRTALQHLVTEREGPDRPQP